MKKKIISVLITGVMIFSVCSCNIFNKEQVKDYTGGNPWIDSNIYENVLNSGEVSPKDDFYLSVNKQWLLDHPVEEGQEEYYISDDFTKKMNERLDEILTEDDDEENKERELVQSLYDAFLDWDARNEAGADPIKPYIQKVEDASTIEELIQISIEDGRGYSEFFPITVMANPSDSKENVAYFNTPEFFLYDTTDYLTTWLLDDYTRMTYDVREKEVVTVLGKCGYTEKEAKDVFKGAYAFERTLMQHQYSNSEWNDNEINDFVMANNLLEKEEMDELEITEYYMQNAKKKGFDDITKAYYWEKMEYYENFDNIFNDDNLENAKDYLIAHTASNSIKYLDEDCYYAYVDGYNELNGISGYKEEKEYARDIVSDMLGWPLSKLYCDEYVTPEEKENITEICYEIIDEYKLMIDEEDFISDETKEKAKEKLDNMLVCCMYPDEWPDYTGLELSGGYEDMICEILEYENKKIAQNYYQTNDRGQWEMTPITVNAYYDWSKNSITILPGLAGDVFYDINRTDEENYGYLGFVIAHEISHGFDTNGALFDAEGNYKDWWTEEDKEQFNQRADKLADYYDDIVVWNGLNCFGYYIKDEACADMAGMACILRIAENTEDFDYDLFFRSYANSFASVMTPGYAYSNCMENPHPRDYLRVNVVLAQFDKFQETYDIKEGDGMYIAPENRVAIW